MHFFYTCLPKYCKAQFNLMYGFRFSHSTSNSIGFKNFFADSLSTMPTNFNHPSFFLCIPLINVRLQKGANKSVNKLYCYITVNIKCAMDTIIHILFTYITAIIICLRSPCQSLIINNFRNDIMIAQGKIFKLS